MKQLAVIFLLFILLFSSTGYYFFFCIDLAAVRHEMSEIIRDREHSNVVSLTFALIDGKAVAPGLVFTDDDEFTYQGKMYDVVSQSQQNGKINYVCYADTKETDLDQKLCKAIDSDLDPYSHKGQNDYTIKTVLKDYTHDQAAIYTFHPDVHVSRLVHIDVSAYLLCAFSAVFSPPPELA